MAQYQLLDFTAKQFREEGEKCTTEDLDTSKFIKVVYNNLVLCYDACEAINADLIYNTIDKLNILVNKVMGDARSNRDFLHTCLINMAKLFKIIGFIYLNNVLTSNPEDVLLYYRKSKYCFMNYCGIINLAFNDESSKKYACEEYLALCEIVFNVTKLFQYYNSIREDVIYTNKDFPDIDLKKIIVDLKTLKVLPITSYSHALHIILKVHQLHKQNKVGDSLGYAQLCIIKLLKNKEYFETVNEYKKNVDMLTKSKKSQKFKNVAFKLKRKHPIKLPLNKKTNYIMMEKDFFDTFMKGMCIPLLFLMITNLEDMNNNVSFQSIKPVNEVQEELDTSLITSLVDEVKISTDRSVDNADLRFKYKWKLINGSLVSI